MPQLKNKNDSSEDQGFSVANDLLQRETGFEERLNRIYGRKTPESERGNSDVVDSIGEAGSDVNNFIKNDNSDETNKNRNGAKNQEEEGDDPIGGGLRKGSRFGGKLNGKRLLPGGIVALLITLVGGGSALIIPSSLVVMIERVLTNNGTHDVRANSTMGRAYMGGIFSPVRDAVCKTKATCMVTSMSSREIKRWSSQDGVRIQEGRNAFGRKIVTSMTVDLPSGGTLTINNAADYKNAVQNNEHFRKLNYKVQHPRAAYFIGPDSKFRSVLKKYKLNLASAFSKAKPGISKAEQAQIYNEEADKKTGAPTGEDPGSRNKSRVEKYKQKVSAAHQKFQSKIGSKASKVGDPAGWISLGCTVYSLQKATLTAVKLNYYSDLIKYFLPFAVLAGQAMEGDVDPELMEYAGDRLTWYQKEATADTPEKKAKVNLTATDSQGFQAALYGDYSKLTDFAKQYAPWWALSAVKTSSMVKMVEEAVGKENMHNTCMTAKYASYLSSFNPLSLGILVGCQLTNWVLDDKCNEVIMSAFQWVVDQSLEEVYQRMEETALDSSLKGVDLGNAIAAGIGLFLMEKGRGSGLMPATSVAAVSTYLAATEDNFRQDTLAQKEDAIDNPFDMTNSYSFTNNVISALTPQKTKETTGLSILANYFSVLTNTFKPLSSTTRAGYFQPIEAVNRTESLQSMTHEGNPDGTGRACQDPDMEDWLCDMYGRSIDVVSPTPLKWAKAMENGNIQPWLDTVAYMENNNYIERDGSAVPVGYSSYKKDPDPENYTEEVYENDYLMYKAYCTNDRVYPLGMTMTAYDDDNGGAENLGWFTGKKCSGLDVEGNRIGSSFDEKLNRYFFYYNTCEVQVGAAYCLENKTDDNTQSLGSVTPNTGDWVAPTSGPCLSKYGMRTLGGRTALHAGIDISPPAGTPIVAPTSMKITLAKYTNDGYGVMVTATATDGSNYSFRFGHMGPNNDYKPPVQVGQEVSKGTVIGVVGNTGGSEGPHLHFEVFPPGKDPASFSGSIDPVPVLRERGVSISCGV